MAVSFNGITKRIAVTGVADFSSVNVEDVIFSRWTDWRKVGDNAKYLQALRPVAGDPIDDTQNAPPYFFLMNDWKVEVDGIKNLNFFYNLYCEKETNTNYDPFVVLSGGSVVSQISNSPTTTVSTGSGLSSEEHDQLMSRPSAGDVWNGVDLVKP